MVCVLEDSTHIGGVLEFCRIVSLLLSYEYSINAVVPQVIRRLVYALFFFR